MKRKRGNLKQVLARTISSTISHNRRVLNESLWHTYDALEEREKLQGESGGRNNSSDQKLGNFDDRLTTGSHIKRRRRNETDNRSRDEIDSKYLRARERNRLAKKLAIESEASSIQTPKQTIWTLSSRNTPGNSSSDSDTDSDSSSNLESRRRKRKEKKRKKKIKKKKKKKKNTAKKKRNKSKSKKSKTKM